MPGVAPTSQGQISNWGTNPKTVIPPQGNPRSPSVVGYQQGVPQSYYGQTALDQVDYASLSAMPSVYNRPRMYMSAGAGQNMHAGYLNGPPMIGSQNQAGDAPTFNTQTVGGSSNGMQAGAGLQVVSGSAATIPVSGGSYPTPPVIGRSKTRNYGNVVSPGTPNIGRPGGPVAGPAAGVIDKIVSNNNWVFVAVGSTIIAFLVNKYFLK